MTRFWKICLRCEYESLINSKTVFALYEQEINLERNGWRLISKIKCKNHVILCWILWLRDEYGIFEKVSFGGRVLRNASAMIAEREVRP